MKTIKAKRIFTGLGLLAVTGMGYCFRAYFRLRELLVPAITELPSSVDRLTIGIVLSVFVMAVFHLFLLVFSLRRLTAQDMPRFFNAVFFSAVILSGNLILSDAALLHDLGAEYLYWDIRMEWTLLLVISAFQTVVMLVGLVLQARTAPQPEVKLFERVQRGNDVVFISLNQVGLTCALAGLVLLFPPCLLPLAERYRAGWSLALAGLAAMPLLLIAVYWLLRNRQKKLNALLDEKQIMDLTFGGFVALCLVAAVLFIYLILVARNRIDLNQPVYIVGLVDAAFAILFATVLRRFGWGVVEVR
jgi:hypothetical protein